MMRAMHLLRHSAGFTLIEVLVAIGVMAVMTIGLASMGVSAMSADTQSRQQSVATTLAKAKLEELRILRRSNADWAETTHTEYVDEEGQAGGAYEREWVVDHDYTVGGTTFANLSRVTVTVYWNGEAVVSLSSLYR